MYDTSNILHLDCIFTVHLTPLCLVILYVIMPISIIYVKVSHRFSLRLVYRICPFCPWVFLTSSVMVWTDDRLVTEDGAVSINEEGSFIHNTKLGTHSYTKWILSTTKQPIWSCATLSWMNTLYSSVVVISGLKSRTWYIVVLASAQISWPARHAPAMVLALIACAVTPLFCRLKTCSLANSKDSLYNPF